MIEDFYIYLTCDKCGARQRVYNGDPNDLTLPDIDAVKCFWCGHVERFDDKPDADPEFSAVGEPVGEPVHP